MASDPQQATAKELWRILSYMLWCSNKELDNSAKSLLDELGCEWPAGRIIGLCQRAQRGITVGCGLPIRLARVKTICEECVNEHLRPDDWARMKDAGGKPTFDPLYLSSQDHMVRLAAYWLCGADAPADVAAYFRRAHLDSRMRAIVTMTKLALLVRSPVLVMQG